MTANGILAQYGVGSRRFVHRSVYVGSLWTHRRISPDREGRRSPSTFAPGPSNAKIPFLSRRSDCRSTEDAPAAFVASNQKGICVRRSTETC